MTPGPRPRGGRGGRPGLSLVPRQRPQPPGLSRGLQRLAPTPRPGAALGFSASVEDTADSPGGFCGDIPAVGGLFRRARRRGLFQWGLRGSAQRARPGRRGSEGVSPSLVSGDSGASQLPGLSRCTCSGWPGPPPHPRDSSPTPVSKKRAWAPRGRAFQPPLS